MHSPISEWVFYVGPQQLGKLVFFTRPFLGWDFGGYTISDIYSRMGEIFTFSDLATDEGTGMPNNTPHFFQT